MDSVNLADVASNLTRLIERAEAGEEIIIYRAGQPVARLMPPVAEEASPTPKPRRQLGILAGQGYWIGDDFDDPLPEIARSAAC